jgi:hypothetical protein
LDFEKKTFYFQMIALPPDMAANGHGERTPPPMVDFCSGASYESLQQGKSTLFQMPIFFFEKCVDVNQS